MRTVLKLVIVLVLLGVAALSTVYATDPQLVPLDVDLVWIIIGASLGVAVLAAIVLIATRRSADRARETMVISPLPYTHEPAFAASTPPPAPARPLGAQPERPLAYVPAPPRVPTQPYVMPAPLADDGPTTADPSAQAAAEEHYQQYRRRLARGSEMDIEGVTQRGVPPAIRANTLQAKPTRAPIVAMWPRK